MKKFLILSICVVGCMIGLAQTKDPEWVSTFPVNHDELISTGRNPYFILEPGYVLVLENGVEQLTITVLNETRRIDNVETRVVEERETRSGKLVEVSRNFFAISKKTNDVYYFGEEVDIYKSGRITGHEGAWLAGQKGARFGLMMPGKPILGARYYQEMAPGVAMDRAEVVSLNVTLKTPAGDFENVLKTLETNPLERGDGEYKYYAPGVGLLQDGPLKLVRYGKG